MWITEALVEAELRTRREEAERRRLVSEARRQARQDGTARAWRWRVEPGMEEAFRNLRGWLLSSQREAAVVQTPSSGYAEATTAAQVPAPSPAKGGESVRCCGFPTACCAVGS